MQESKCVHGTIMEQLDSRECRRRRAMMGLCQGLFERMSASFPCFDGSSAFSRDQEPQMSCCYYQETHCNHERKGSSITTLGSATAVGLPVAVKASF
jgi:hypothetical protein